MMLIGISCGYIIASVLQLINLFGKLNFSKWLLPLLSVALLFAHGCFLYQLIETDKGQNLDAMIMLSMILWIMGLLIFFSFNRALSKLNLIVFLLAGITLPIVSNHHGNHVIHHIQPLMLFHVLISFMATSVLLLAFFHAGLLSCQNYLLKQNMNHPVLKILPPLVHMERLLFVIIATGFALLTLSLISGYSNPELLLSSKAWPKILLATLAWCMFLCILLARRLKGLRGKSAHRLTLISGALLFLSYFGTKLFL